jgi:hypothetical protein
LRSEWSCGSIRAGEEVMKGKRWDSSESWHPVKLSFATLRRGARGTAGHASASADQRRRETCQAVRPELWRPRENLQILVAQSLRIGKSITDVIRKGTGPSSSNEDQDSPPTYPCADP